MATIDRLRKRGLAGRAYWLSGKSGVGKTTIAKLLAEEIADPLNVEEYDAAELTPARIKEMERASFCTRIGNKQGLAYLVNEAHGLRSDAVRQLLVTLERIPGHAVWEFTTTKAGQESLFADEAERAPAHQPLPGDRTGGAGFGKAVCPAGSKSRGPKNWTANHSMRTFGS